MTPLMVSFFFEQNAGLSEDCIACMIEICESMFVRQVAGAI